MRILFFAVKKKIKNQDTQPCAKAVGNEVKPVTTTSRDEVLLNHFGQAAVGNTDDNGE